ncbi:MAG: VgrG-related protein [Tolypothrix sp. T3-bin4]|nr:VgrG-related protein [Tolypothrix sp. T3-bin4]
MPEIRYVAKPSLEIDGNKAPEDLMEDILQISVEESLHLAGMFTLIIQNAYAPGREQDKAWKHKDLFAIGKSIKIGFGSSTTEAQEFQARKTGDVLEGEITAMETHFTSGSQAPMIIRGYDISHRLHRGRYNRSFQNMTDSDIVKKIAKEVGIEFSNRTIDNSGAPHDYVFQENQTNMEFLRERAARIGFELFIQDGKLNFRKPKVDGSLELKWLKDLHSFRVRVSSAEQVSEVEVRGWDYSRKQPIVENANTENVLTDTKNGKGSKTSTSFKGKPPKPKMIVVDQPIFTPGEAKAMAQALCDELGGEFVLADAKGEGNPEIRPGRVVNLKEMGSYSGKYYVTETRHSYYQGVYHTEFSIRGLRGGNLFTILSPKNHLQPSQTCLVGIVTDNKDPKGWGRVKVKFPTLTDKHASNWARVVAPGAGPNRGVYWLPEVNDEVLVAFEHGDMHRPYVIGGVWNGTDPTPRTIGDTVAGGVRLRVSKTRLGHQAWFVDEDKGAEKKGYYIQTVAGHWIRFNDTEKFVEIETAGGHKMRLDDMKKSVSISSTGSMKITAQTQIEISAPNIKVTGKAVVDVKGGVIKLN